MTDNNKLSFAGKTWKLIFHEYTRHVLRKRFIFALLSVPIWILIAVGAGVISVMLQLNSNPVGYVDQAGQIDGVNLAQVADESSGGFRPLEFIAYESETQAQAALNAGKIQAFFVISPDYADSLETRLVYLEQPDSEVLGQFSDILRVSLLKDQDSTIANRILEGSDLVIEATQEDRQMANNEWFKVAAPIVAAIFLVVSVFTTSGYLMQAIVEEKENRTMELLATSLSPMQIMGGKIIALISVGLTQVLVWSIFPILVIVVARAYVPFLQGIEIDWKLFGLAFITAFPTFILVSALMATIGATATEAREGQQVSSLVTLPIMAPFMLFSAILVNPGGIIAVALSLFPLSAALTLLLRMAFATVPVWQIILSVTVLLISAAGSLWLSGKIFRIGMMRYGKRMSLKEVFQAVSPRRKSIRKEEAPASE